MRHLPMAKLCSKIAGIETVHALTRRLGWAGCHTAAGCRVDGLRLLAEEPKTVMDGQVGEVGSVEYMERLTAIVKNRLNSIQYRPTLIDAFLAQAGLALEPEPP